MLQVFNTLTRQKEKFISLEEGKVRFYHCGPTVYWIQHIGNLRGAVTADLIRRSLEYLGYEVRFVRNYTDVGHLTGDNIGDADTGEDRMEKAAKREHLDPQTIAQKYIDIYEKDAEAINIKEPNAKPVATQYVEQMIDLVQKLLDKGFAYATPKAIYFDVAKFPGYNKLNRQKLEENIQGEGKGEVSDPDKKHPYDFALWFFKTGVHKNALQYWSSPFSSPEVENGEGIPGWHIECSAMAIDLLGETLDLHMGGIEHISIHHTNEIAQSEAATGKTFSRYWLHNEHLVVDNKKMSKSKGNGYILEDVREKGYDPLALRYFFLTSHYRSRQNFTWEALDAAANALNKLRSNVERMLSEIESAEMKPKDESSGIGEESGLEFQGKFTTALEDDFNIPQALAVVWEMLKSEIPAASKYVQLMDFDKVLGLRLVEISSAESVLMTEEIKELMASRVEARESKDWKMADHLRDKIEQLSGKQLKDTDKGQKLY